MHVTKANSGTELCAALISLRIRLSMLKFKLRPLCPYSKSCSYAVKRGLGGLFFPNLNHKESSEKVFSGMVLPLPQKCKAPQFLIQFIRSLSAASPSRPIISLVLWCSHAAIYPHIQTSSISCHGDIRLKFWYAHIGWLVTTDQLDKWWLGFGGEGFSSGIWLYEGGFRS